LAVPRAVRQLWHEDGSSLPSSALPVRRQGHLPVTHVEETTSCDVTDWFGPVPAGCDVSAWIQYMTADELGLAAPKLTIDFDTGEISVSVPTRQITA
jgi:hypothetical protein